MNYPINPRPASLHRQSGFSLVEVTLAIGIVAFAFISLFGLLPTGMNVFRSAIDASIGSQIVQQVTQDAQQTDYQTLIRGATSNNSTTDNTPSIPDTYYDEQGSLLTDLQGIPVSTPGDVRSIYRVRVIVTAPTQIPSQNPGPSTTTPNVATLRILIAKDPSHSNDPFTSGSNTSITRYVSYVSRNLSAFEAQ